MLLVGVLSSPGDAPANSPILGGNNMPRGIKKKTEAKIEEPAKEKWVPTPDMGDIKPPAEKEKSCGVCTHKKAVHYGSIKEWCNTSGCNCQEFK